MKTYGTLTFQPIFKQGHWVLEAEPHIYLRAKRVFAQLKSDPSSNLILTHSNENCRDLEWFLARYPIAMSDADRTILAAGAAQHRDYIQTLEELIDPNYEPPTFELAIPARAYQRRGAAVALQTSGVLIADDVGLGKTTTSICVLTDPKALPAIVVTLAHLPKQWAYEVQKFAPALTTHIITHGTPYELPKFFGRGPDVVIINYHKLAKWAKVLAKYGRSVIFDEVQELRHRESQKYKAAQALVAATAVKVGLSATPIYNYGGEIYNILNLLRPGSLGSYNEFGTEWCGYSRPGKSAPIKDPKAFGSWAREQFLIVRHTRKEVGRELPPIQRMIHTVESDPEALKNIEASASELARLILSQNAAARGQQWRAAQELSLLLRQATGIAKAPYVADFVRILVESGEKVVVFAWHREVYRVLEAKLKDLKPVMYTGSESAIQKANAVTRFKDGNSQVFLMSLRSGAGLNGLQECSKVCVFAELDWSPGVHEQNIGRLARDGQDDSVLAYFLVTEDGSDPVIAELLGLKREQVEGIRNPGADVLEELQVDPEHIRRLATFYLSSRGERMTEVG